MDGAADTGKLSHHTANTEWTKTYGSLPNMSEEEADRFQSSKITFSMCSKVEPFICWFAFSDSNDGPPLCRRKIKKVGTAPSQGTREVPKAMERRRVVLQNSSEIQ